MKDTKNVYKAGVKADDWRKRDHLAAVIADAGRSMPAGAREARVPRIPFVLSSPAADPCGGAGAVEGNEND